MRPYRKFVRNCFGENSRRIFIPQLNPEKQHLLFYPTLVGYEEILPDYYNEKDGAPFFMLQYTVSGGGTLKIQNEVIHLRAGDFVFLNAYEHHIMRPDENMPWSIYFIHIIGEEAPKFLSAFNRKIHVAAHNYPERFIVPHIQKILSLATRVPEIDFYDISQEIYKIFINMMRFLDGQPDRIYDELRFVLSYIYANYTRRDLSLDEIAGKSAYSKSHLEKLFRSQLNTTPMQHVANLRFHKCQQLILSTNKTLAEVADESGLSDERALIYMFKKHLETTPTKFKQGFLNKNAGDL